jgi:hypothetical protein
MPKGADWIASNGDRIMDGFFVHHLLVGMMLWFIFLFASLPFIFRRKKQFAI